MERIDDMPEWVYWGLWGIRSRGVALGFMGFCLLAGIASVWIALDYPLAWLGLEFFFAAGWYWFAVRWVDAHGAWPSPARS